MKARCTARRAGAHITGFQTGLFQSQARNPPRGRRAPYKPHMLRGIRKARQPAGSRKRHSGMLHRAKHAAPPESFNVNTHDVQENYLQGRGVGGYYTVRGGLLYAAEPPQ